ncbi:MAG: hypothetical protein ACEQSA_01505 [Weeksellaceae bacterium]
MSNSEVLSSLVENIAEFDDKTPLVPFVSIQSLRKRTESNLQDLFCETEDLGLYIDDKDQTTFTSIAASPHVPYSLPTESLALAIRAAGGTFSDEYLDRDVISPHLMVWQGVKGNDTDEMLPYSLLEMQRTFSPERNAQLLEHFGGSLEKAVFILQHALNLSNQEMGQIIETYLVVGNDPETTYGTSRGVQSNRFFHGHVTAKHIEIIQEQANTEPPLSPKLALKQIAPWDALINQVTNQGVQDILSRNATDFFGESHFELEYHRDQGRREKGLAPNFFGYALTLPEGREISLQESLMLTQHLLQPFDLLQQNLFSLHTQYQINQSSDILHQVRSQLEQAGFKRSTVIKNIVDLFHSIPPTAGQLEFLLTQEMSDMEKGKITNQLRRYYQKHESLLTDEGQLAAIESLQRLYPTAIPEQVLQLIRDKYIPTSIQDPNRPGTRASSVFARIFTGTVRFSRYAVKSGKVSNEQPFGKSLGIGRITWAPRFCSEKGVMEDLGGYALIRA